MSKLNTKREAEVDGYMTSAFLFFSVFFYKCIHFYVNAVGKINKNTQYTHKHKLINETAEAEQKNHFKIQNALNILIIVQHSNIFFHHSLKWIAKGFWSPWIALCVIVPETPARIPLCWFFVTIHSVQWSLICFIPHGRCDGLVVVHGVTVYSM